MSGRFSVMVEEAEKWLISMFSCFHHVGLSKGFLQSLLAFCPPPSTFFVIGGGHTVNGALLASL